MASQVDHTVSLASLGISRNDPRALNPANAQAVCGDCHAYKTERERIKALAESNRARAQAKRERQARRLGRDPHSHPGYQGDD